MQHLLDEIIQKNKKYTKEGSLASYIPALTRVNKEALGISIVTLDGKVYNSGNYDQYFTIQSISKVISLIIAINDNGRKKVFEKVGMEPTAEGFNSIVNLEVKKLDKPYNPMINAGAIVTTSLIEGSSKEEKIERILEFTRRIMGNPKISIDEEVYLSEKESGNRNRALAYYMKSNNILDGDIEEILDLYFKQCSMLVNAVDIARLGAVLANDGVMPWNNERIISRDVCRIVKTIMVTCGMYDSSGEFAVHIGIPAKSGVGGGILASVPRRMGIGVYGPSLDEKGNSIGGTHMLRDLSEELDLSIF